MAKTSFTVALLLAAAVLFGDQPQKPKKPDAPAKDGRSSGQGDTTNLSYCPQYLMGEYNNTYYYYCQNCSQPGCGNYCQVATQTAYACGGCCNNCCNTACLDTITQMGNSQMASKSVQDDEFEVIPFVNDLKITQVSTFAENVNGTYQSGDVHFCPTAPNFQVQEFFLLVSATNAAPYTVFRCFDVTDTLRPRQQLRVGQELSPAAWSSASISAASYKTQYDTSYPGMSPHHHRVKVLEGPETGKMFYLLSATPISPPSP